MTSKKLLNKKTICFVNKFSSIGGSGTFLHNLNHFFKKKKYIISYFDSKKKSDYIFITGSNFRNIFWIIFMRLFGSKIITRVDGKNWIYKYSYFNLRVIISSIFKNFSIYFFQIISDKIIYQSEFVKKEWQNFLFSKKCKIIYNGSKPNFVLRKFLRSNKPTLISVEGSVDAAFNSSNLIKDIAHFYNYNYEIYGSVSQKTVKRFQNLKNVKFYGPINRKQILKILAKRKKYIFISLEMFAPCPNSVIEAINHGIPVIGYKQGSMKEIISVSNGILLNVSNKLTVNKLELANSIMKINNNYNFFNKKLKKINKKFTLEYMLNRYESEILNT